MFYVNRDEEGHWFLPQFPGNHISLCNHLSIISRDIIIKESWAIGQILLAAKWWDLGQVLSETDTGWNIREFHVLWQKSKASNIAQVSITLSELHAFCQESLQRTCLWQSFLHQNFCCYYKPWSSIFSLNYRTYLSWKWLALMQNKWSEVITDLMPTWSDIANHSC